MDEYKPIKYKCAWYIVNCSHGAAVHDGGTGEE